MKKKLFAGLTIGLLLIGMFGIAEAISYNPTTDFSIDNGNPNGVWSYGWMPTDFSSFNLYTGKHMNDNVPSGSNSNPQWFREPPYVDYTPCIWRNDNNFTWYGVGAGQISLHPSSSGEASVLRWTAQFNGEYDINGKFLNDDIYTMQVGIRQGSSWLWDTYDAFALNRSFVTGESIDFLVYGGYYGGNTPLDLIISSHTDPIPEPSTCLLLLFGMLGMVSIIKHQKV